MGITISSDEFYMQIAIDEAQKARQLNEVPVGAILVLANKIIAKAHNKSIINNDSCAHAEIELIRKAGAKLKNYRLINSTIYTTLEPCAMCFGAIIHARITRLVFGAYDKKTGVCTSRANFNELDFFNHKLQITGGILATENQKILKEFFNNKRNT